MTSTAASRPGGKFGGRGKTGIGRGKTSLPSKSSSSKTNNDDDTTSTTIDQVTMEKIKSQRSKLKRQEVFDKLDQAESVVLNILNIARNTAMGLEYLAMENPLKKTSNAKASENEFENKDRIRENEKNWKNKIHQNGKLYMDNLKQIHDLLMPHSNLVVDYGSVAKQENTSKGSGNKDESESKDVKVDSANMYSSRLEMRLAVDKKNLLNDLVQLEKKMLKDEQESNNAENVKSSTEKQDVPMVQIDENVGNKRKRED